MKTENTTEERKPLYATGDKVEVINYGHPYWSKELNTDHPLNYLGKVEYGYYYDMSPELVGKQGIIEKVSITQGIPQYSLIGIPGKTAWYDEKQLKLISKNPNKL